MAKIARQRHPVARYAAAARTGWQTAKSIVRTGRNLYQAVQAGKRVMSRWQTKRLPRQTLSPRRVLRAGGYNYFGRNKGGRYRGRIAARKIKPRTKVNSRGIIIKKEYGGTVSTAMSNSIYLGHGCASKEMFQHAVRAILKRLFNKAGFAIPSWDWTIAQASSSAFETGDFLVVRVETNPSNPTLANTASAFSFAQTDTFESVMIGVSSIIQTLFVSTTTNIDQWEIVGMSLAQVNGGQKIGLSNLNVRETFIEIGYFSHMVVQNRTNDANDSENIESTSNNPAHGQVYESKGKWMNGFELSQRAYAPGAAGVQNFYAQTGTGLIIADSSVTQPAILSKPPKAWMFGVQRSAGVKIGPGDIKHTSHKWSANMKFNTLLMKLFKSSNVSHSDNQTFKVEIGYAQLLGMECMLFDRSETVQFQFSYELNQTYWATCSERQPRTPAIVVVSTSLPPAGEPV